MKTVRKACVGLLRPSTHGFELLVFEHPRAGIQLPKGGVEPNETGEQAALRELYEETGVSEVGNVTAVGTWQRYAGSGPQEAGPLERHVWEVFAVEAPPGLPPEWHHDAWGSAVEQGLRFRCHWLPLDADTHQRLHTLFEPVVQMLFRQARLGHDRWRDT